MEPNIIILEVGANKRSARLGRNEDLKPDRKGGGAEALTFGIRFYRCTVVPYSLHPRNPNLNKSSLLIRKEGVRV